MKLLNKHFLKWLGQLWFLFLKRCTKLMEWEGVGELQWGCGASITDLEQKWGWTHDPPGTLLGSHAVSTLCCHLSEGKQTVLVLPGGSDTEPDLLESCAMHNIFIMTNACVVLGAFSSSKRSVSLVLQALSTYEFNTSSSVSSVLSMSAVSAKN